MLAPRVGIGIGLLSFVLGLAGGIWALWGFVASLTFGHRDSVSAPLVLRTDPAVVRPLPKDLDGLFQTSRSLSKGQVMAMRRRLEADPGDARTHALLLDHSWFDFEAPQMNALHNEQLVWFVANEPGSPVLRTKAAEILPLPNDLTRALVRRLFEQALARHPKDREIARNAVRFGVAS